MKAIKRAIILCWIMLIVCFIIKLFGGNWFEIICNNEHFVLVCEYIDSNLVINYLISFVLYVGIGYFIYAAMSKISKPNTRQLIYIFVVLVGIWFVSLWNTSVKSIIEIFAFIVSPYLINIMDKNTRKGALKNNWYRGIIGCVMVFGFQAISLITRNIGLVVTEDNFLVTLILTVDYYIMVFLCYLYIKLKIKKEQENG